MQRKPVIKIKIPLSLQDAEILRQQMIRKGLIKPKPKDKK